MGLDLGECGIEKAFLSLEHFLKALEVSPLGDFSQKGREGGDSISAKAVCLLQTRRAQGAFLWMGLGEISLGNKC